MLKKPTPCEKVWPGGFFPGGGAEERQRDQWLGKKEKGGKFGERQCAKGHNRAKKRQGVMAGAGAGGGGERNAVLSSAASGGGGTKQRRQKNDLTCATEYSATKKGGNGASLG